MRGITCHVLTLVLLAQVLVIALAPVLSVAAQAVKGVYAGNYFTYGKFSSWVNPTSVPKFPEWKLFENISSTTFTIMENPLGEDPTQIVFNQTISFTNGTKDRWLAGGVNLESGFGQGYLFFVYAELEKGSRVYPGSQNFTWTVNETLKDPYWGGREICVLNQTKAWQEQGIWFYRKTITNWDKQTGALLKLYDTTAGYGGSGTMPIEGGIYCELIKTDRFPIEARGGVDYTPVFVAVGVVSVVGAVVTAVRLSSGSSKKKWKRLKE
jgi:hypothetical protein